MVRSTTHKGGGGDDNNGRIRYGHQSPLLSNGLAQIQTKEESISKIWGELLS